MPWLRRLFSFRGRAGRLEFWLLAIPITAVVWGALVMAVGVDEEQEALVLFLICVSLVAAVANLALGVRRLHERGRTGWWMALYHGVPTALLVYVGAASDSGDSPSSWLALPLIGVVLVGLVDLGLLGAKTGPNRYVAAAADASVFD